MRDGHAVETQLERGLEPPPWYHEEPHLGPAEAFFLRAFWDLDSERQVGMALGRIPRSKVFHYGSEAGLDSAMMDVLWRLIQRMDAAYLTWVQKEQEKKSKTSGKGIGNRVVHK